MAELLQFPFAAGIDEGTDPKALPPGTPLVMTNRVLDKKGRTRKRWGVRSKTTAIIGGGNVAAGERLITRGDDLGVFDGTTLYGYSSELEAWQALDRPSPLMARKLGSLDTSHGIGAMDLAVAGDLLVEFYTVDRVSGTAASCAYYAVRSISTGAHVVPPTLVSADACYNPRVLINGAGTVAYFVCNAVSAASVKIASLNLATLVLTAAADLITAVAATSAMDAVIGTSAAGESLYVGYEKSAGVNRITLAVFTLATLAAGGTLSVVGANLDTICVSFGALANSVTAGYGSWTENKARLWTVDVNVTGTVFGPTNIVNGTVTSIFVAEDTATLLLVGTSSNDLAHSAVGAGAAAETVNTFHRLVATHATPGGSVAARSTYGLYRPSKPWRVGTRWFMAATTFLHPYASTTDDIALSSSVVVEVETSDSLTGVSASTHPHVATLENLTGWFAPIPTHLGKAAVDASGTVYIPAAARKVEPGNSVTAIAVRWDVHSLTLGGGDFGRAAILGKSALCAAAAPFWFDGVKAFPYGFQLSPQILAVTASNNGGILAVGTYGYVTVYGWPDAQGVLHRSIPSPPKTGTTAGANLTLDVQVSTSSLSGKQRPGTSPPMPVLIETYRTIVDGADYYRLTYEPVYGVIINNPATSDQTLRDTKADASVGAAAPAIPLARRPQIYTANALDNAPPPAALTVLSHKDRLWLLASDGHTVWPSKAASEDPEVAPGFNEALTLYFAHEKIALGPLDDSVVVLGPDSIDIIGGLGPDNQGNGSWAQGAMQTDVGCVEPRSVVAIPQGLVFQSRRSLEILTRERTLGWFGEHVQDTLDAFPTITSAVVVPGQHQVRFTCNNAGLTDGVVLVFDYVRSAWSVFDYGFAVADAALIGGVYTLLRYNGVVLQEDTTTHLDDGAYVASAVEMPISPSGPNAWHRVKAVQVLGTSVTNHDLTIRMRRDFASAYEQNETFAAQGVVTTVGPLESARMTLARQKGQGFSFRIEDSSPTTGALGIGAGPILEGLSLYVQRKEGPPKLSAGRKR